MAEKYTIDTPAADAMTIEKIWPKLNSSQHEWVNNLTADELHTLKKQLNHYGERYSLKYWQSYVNDFEYAETF